MLSVPEDRYVEVEGHRIRYWDTGSGPPLLFIHGLGNSLLTWRANALPLGKHFRVLALDLPGHGLSDMPRHRYDLPAAASFVVHFMDAVGVERAALVGNSMGGAVAMETALEHPERVSGLVLVNSAGLGSQIARMLRVGSIPWMGERFDRATYGGMHNLCRFLMFDPSLIDGEVVREMLRYRQRPGAMRALLQYLRSGVSIWGQRRSIRRITRLAELHIPLLVVWGRQDRLIPVSHALLVAKVAPTATVHVFDRCGHWPQIEHAEQFNALVKSFLVGVDASSLESRREVQEPGGAGATAGDVPWRVEQPRDEASIDLPSVASVPMYETAALVFPGMRLDLASTRVETASRQTPRIHREDGGLVRHGIAFLERQHHVRAAIFITVLAIVVAVFLNRGQLTDFQHIIRTLGYPAVFLLSVVGAAALVIPFPGTAAIFFGGALLTPVYVGLIAGVGEALGEMTGYGLGYSGQGILKRTRLYRHIEGWVDHQGWVPILLFSIIPNPIFDVLGVAVGAVRYPLLRFLVYAWIGKTIKNIGIAYAGYLGADWVAHLIGLGGA